MNSHVPSRPRITRIGGVPLNLFAQVVKIEQSRNLTAKHFPLLTFIHRTAVRRARPLTGDTERSVRPCCSFPWWRSGSSSSLPNTHYAARLFVGGGCLIPVNIRISRGRCQVNLKELAGPLGRIGLVMSKVEYRPVNYRQKCVWCVNDATQEALQDKATSLPSVAVATIRSA